MAHVNQNTRVIRVRVETKEKLQKVAREERRTMSAQLDLIMETFLAERERER